MVVPTYLRTASLIVKAMMRLGINEEDAASRIGVTGSCVGHWCKGTAAPNTRNSMKACEALRIDYDEYLAARSKDRMDMAGKNQASVDAPASEPPQQSEANPSVSQIEDAVLGLLDISVQFSRLTANQRDVVQRFSQSIDSLSNEQCQSILAIVATMTQGRA